MGNTYKQVEDFNREMKSVKKKKNWTRILEMKKI